MPKSIGYVVKIVKDEHEVIDILLQCLDIFAFFVFIELCDSSSCDDLAPCGFSMKSLIVSSQCLAS